jgi:hypothetical protein
MLAGIGGIGDIALTTTNGALLVTRPRRWRRRLGRVTVSLDSLDDAVFMALNDAGFPAARVLDAITAAMRRRAGAGEGEHGGQARGERAVDPADGSPFPAAGTCCGSSSTWTSARPTAGGWRRSSPPRRSSR